MAYPKSLRKQLGISQEAFATLVKCTEGQLAMTEIGKRELPFESSPFLVALELAAVQATDNPETLLTLTDRSSTWLNKHIKACEATKLSLQLQLEKATQKITELQTLVQVANFVNGNPIFDVSKTQGLQLEVLKRKAEQKLKDCQLQMIKLQISIAGLEAEITKASELIAS